MTEGFFFLTNKNKLHASTLLCNERNELKWPYPHVIKLSKSARMVHCPKKELRELKTMWNGSQPLCPVRSSRSILWLIVNALRGKWMWSWLFTAWMRGTVAVIMIKNKKCQQLIWYTATWLSDRLAYNPTGVTLQHSLLAKCQGPTWLLSSTVWYPQAALADSAEVQGFNLCFSVSLEPNVQGCTPVGARWGWRRGTAACLSLEDQP